MKVAFLDRDGTIIKDYDDHVWASIDTPEFLEGSIEALKTIQNKGYKIVIITNQYLIGEGIITQEGYDKFTHKFLSVLKKEGVKILDIFYCPHKKSDNCECFKPKPKMIFDALEKYPKISLKDSFLCGDQESDIILANAFNLDAYFIQQEISESNLNFKSIKSLKELSNLLI